MGKLIHQEVDYSIVNEQSLTNMIDTSITSPAEGNILQYDGTTSKWKNATPQEHTTFNGRSGSILPIAGDYNSTQVALSSVLNIGGGTQTNVQQALVALSNNSGNNNIITLNDVQISNLADKDTLIYDLQKNKWINKHQLKIVTWADGTDEEIAMMLEAHYNNEIDITDYWSVGDERTVSLSAMEATGVGESHRAQDVTMVILDFNHDDLTTSINRVTKAAVTISQKNCLRDASVSDTTGSSNTEHGYMNSSNSNSGGWTNCERRAWCNNIYYNALPSTFKELIKQVNKLTSAGNQSTTINTDSDYCWLPSEIEIFGSVTYSKSGEGTQYEYYKTASNRYKLPKWYSSGVSDYWWERSPYGSNTTGFCCVNDSGGAYDDNASLADGLAPAYCL